MGAGKQPRVLYVTYNGLLEPIGQSQILPYLNGLAASGIKLGVVSFEKPAQSAERTRARLRAELRERGIRWVALRYHRSRAWPVKLYDMVVGAMTVTLMALVWRVQLVHVRNAVAGAMAIPARVLLRRRLLFDPRGLNAEEYVDGSGWSRQSARYRMLKALEGYLTRHADQVVVLTERVRRLLHQGEYAGKVNGVPIQVIPCCVDLTLFDRERDGRPPGRELPAGRPLFVYLGSLGTWYLLDEMLACFRCACDRWPSAHLLLLTPSDRAIVEQARDRLGIPEDRVTTLSVPYADVPAYLARADVGLCFIKPSLSKLGSSPTKIAEYLACGIPVLANADVGDVEEVVVRHRVGVVVREFTEETYRHALDQMAEFLKDPQEVRRRCRAAAEREFSLRWAIRQYRDIYERVLSGK